MGAHDDAERAEMAALRLQAVAMKRSGMTYQQIADSIPSYNGARATAYKQIKRALSETRELLAESVEQLILMEDERDDDLRRRLYGVLSRPHYVVQGGAVVLGLDGNPLLDDMPVMHAIDRLGALSKRFSARHGLDAPERIEIAFEERTDLEVRRVVEAILAGFAAADLPAEKRMVALEAAQANLAVIDGEVVSDTGDPE